MNIPYALMRFLLVPVSVFAGMISPYLGSHTLTGLATYIRGEGAFSATIMLDDITVGYYNSETKIYVARGNDTNEDDVVDPDELRSLSENVLVHFIERSHHLRPVNNTESPVVYQVMSVCEQSDNNLGQIISKTAYRGSTVDERCFLDGKFTFSNYTEEIKPNLKMSKLHIEKLYYPICIKTLKNYLKKRETQVNRKVKPRVRLIQKANSDSGGSRVSCLATGFYPRHINLTLFRDGQPVSDHEITGGDLLPNDDGTYQMRKSLEISAADKHTYTCSATHLSLDNKLDVTLGVLALQRLVVCELRDDGEPGQMITRDAVRGSTTDELLYVDKNFTYQGSLNVSAEVLNIHIEFSMRRHEVLYQPFCIKTLTGYLKKRRTQINRKVKPKVRLLQKELSSGFLVSCLATGFYPRHINLTLFRDRQPIADHEITGGDLLPNDDGTYQMRKSLEISAADKHTYTCSVTHLSLDNKLDIDLEFDPGEPFKSLIPSVLIVLALMLVFGTGLVIYKCRRRRAASIKSDYSSASTSEENMDPAS